MELPKEKSKPTPTLDKSITLIYGPPKVGKSTFCSQAPSPLFLATEPGLNALETFNITINNWGDMLDALGQIAKGEHDFQTIVIDTVDNAFQMCSEHVCAQQGITHESELGYGKGWALVRNEFQRVVNKLARLPYGLIMVSHSKEIEIDSRVGKYTKIVSTLPDKARDFICGLVDFILYCEVNIELNESGQEEEHNKIKTKPSKHYDAGDRYKVLPEVINLDYNEFEKHIRSSNKKTKETK